MAKNDKFEKGEDIPLPDDLNQENFADYLGQAYVDNEAASQVKRDAQAAHNDEWANEIDDARLAAVYKKRLMQASREVVDDAIRAGTIKLDPKRSNMTANGGAMIAYGVEFEYSAFAMLDYLVHRRPDFLIGVLMETFTKPQAPDGDGFMGTKVKDGEAIGYFGEYDVEVWSDVGEAFRRNLETVLVQSMKEVSAPKWEKDTDGNILNDADGKPIRSKAMIPSHHVPRQFMGMPLAVKTVTVLKLQEKALTDRIRLAAIEASMDAPLTEDERAIGGLPTAELKEDERLAATGEHPADFSQLDRAMAEILGGPDDEDDDGTKVE